MKIKKTKKPNEFHFRGQMKDEKVIEFFRMHWLVLLPDIVPFFLYISGLIVFILSIGRFKLPTLNEPLFQILICLIVIGTAFMIHRFFLKLIEYFLRMVIITNYRVVEVKKSLFLRDDKHSIIMKRIQDIQKKQTGIIKNIIKVGELVIIISFSDPRTLRNVPSPDFHFRLLNQVRNTLTEREHQPIEENKDINFNTVTKTTTTYDNSVLKTDD